MVETLSEEPAMAKRATGYGAITRVTITKHGKPMRVWRLEMAAHTKSGRKRLRRYFAYKPDAEAAQDAELVARSDRTRWLASLPGTITRPLEEMIEKLEKLPEEVRQAFDWSRLPALIDDHAWMHEPYPIEDVFNAYIDEQKALKKRPQTPTKEERRAKKKETYLTTVSTMMSRLYEDKRFPKTRNAKTVSKAEVVDWCNKLRERLNPDTVDTYVRIGRAVWNRAIELEKLRTNPFVVVKKATRGEAYFNLIVIHSPEEMERMMTVAWDYDPGMLGYIALGYIFGLRPCEVIELEREDIHREDGYIQVKRGKGSGNGAAFVRSVRPLDEAQWRWLSPILDSNLPICPPDYAQRLTRLRELAGLPAWERSIFRRTALSYWYANGVSEAEVKKRAGHRDRSGVAFTNYLAEINPKVAPRFPKILPPSRPAGTCAFPAAPRKSSKSKSAQGLKQEVDAPESLPAMGGYSVAISA